jgi:WD40 repeat protein/DNA-binding SARP family transcriptional activator/class 3 adenylate cyclase/tRNA A-37 threonylcarbamoyl transferase component Bud32
MDPRDQGSGPSRAVEKRSILDRVRGSDRLSAESSGTPARHHKGGPDAVQPGEDIRTFLVADVRGYTTFTHERGDEAAAALAARFADVVRQEVETRGGSLLELRGDEALVTFRSPRQAIRAAVDLQRRFLDEARATPDVPLPVGIGLDVGEAVPVGTGYRGGVLNVAARLCGEAGPGEILATQSLVHVARTVDGVRYVDRGVLHLKGLTDPVHILTIAASDVDIAEQIRALLPRRPGRRIYGGKMHFRVLGPLEVDGGSGPINLGGPKQRAVLAHLLIRSNELVPAERLIDEVWGDEPPERVRNIVQTYISHLRKALGPDRIQSQAPGYRLRVEPSELDAAQFDALLRDAKKALLADPNLAVGMLEDALSLWRGPALADLADHPSLVAETTRLDDQRLEAQEDRVEGLLASGAHTTAIRELEGLIGRHPLRERLWSMLMLALYREGRQAEALQGFQRAREILADELGIDPSAELARLHERILKQDPSLEVRGEPLRGYRLLEKIGQGRTGVVFRAIQPHVGRDVAVKVIHERVAADASFVRRFEPEAQAVAALEHPHIAPVHDYWREPGRAYVVTRYLRGGSLRALEQRGASFEGDRALRMIEQVASALAFAHRQDVVHGDVGPSNVLFDAEGHAYLADFRIGVSSHADRSDDVRALAALVKRWAPKGSNAAEVADRAEVGSRSPDADEFAAAARAALEPGSPAPPRRTDERNPYKGLRPFTEADARDFFGRGEMTHRLLSRLDANGSGSRFLAVVGPSGAGKSSVVRAGVVPAIRRGALGDAETTFVGEMFPGQHPLEELEAALLRIAVRPGSRLQGELQAGSRGLLEAVDAVTPAEANVVLVVDQFEELFTLTTDERERELFLESLRVATAEPDSRLRVIVTLRADFYDRPLVYPRFGELLAARTEAVPPLTPDELEQAIRGPTEQVGVRAERGVVAEMIADVAHQPGALPLLQYALTELFEQRDEGRLTLDAYERMGRVGGALSAAADRLYESTDAEGRRAIKQVFLRLVTLGEGRQDTRRRVARSELDALDVGQEAIDGVLEPFGRHRLLTFDREPTTREPAVEIAHEALLVAWSRLRIWIDDAREDLRQEQGLARAAVEWRGFDMDPSFLLRGTRLEQFVTWAASTDLAIGRPERAYLRASEERRERERAEEQERLDRERRTERRSRNRLRAFVAVLAVAALVAGSLTVVATQQSGRAEREARIAGARELAAAAVANLEVDPERSILLAMEAIHRTRSVDGTVLPEAEDALHQAIGASRVVLTVPGLGGAVAWSAKGVFVTEGPEDSGLIDIRDVQTGGREIHPFEGHDVDINDVVFDPSGSLLATAGDDGALRIWDPGTGKLLMQKVFEGEVFGPSFDADGSLVAAAWKSEGVVRVLDVSTGRVVMTYEVSEANDTSLSPAGTQVAVSSLDGQAFAIDVASARRTATYTRGPFQTNAVAWSPDGRYVAVADQTKGSGVFEADTGVRRFDLPSVTFTLGLAWDPTGAHRIVGGQDGGSAIVWHLGRYRVTEIALPAQEMRNGIAGVAFSPDGREVMAGSSDITAVKIWDLSLTGDEEVANLPATMDYISDVGFMPDGRRLVAHSPDSDGLTVWDLADHRAVGEFGPPWPPMGAQQFFEVSPEGSVAIMDPDRVTVWDVATQTKRFALRPEQEIGSMGWSPDGEYLAVGSGDGSATIVDRSGRTVRVLRDDGRQAICDARFSPDGRFVATAACRRDAGSVNPHITIWDWRRAEKVRTIEGLEAWRVRFDPTGGRIVTLAWPQGAEIWDVATDRRIVALGARPGVSFDVEFSPDGDRVAVGGSIPTVTVYDTHSGQQLLTLRGLPFGSWNLAFSLDGTLLAAATHTEVRVWTMDIDDLLRIARDELTRTFTDEECDQYLHGPCPRRALAGS